MLSRENQPTVSGLDSEIKTETVLVSVYFGPKRGSLVLLLLLLLLLTTGLAVRLTVLAGGATTTTTTGLGTTLHTNCIGHVSVSGGEFMREGLRPVCMSDRFGDLLARWRWRWPQTRGSSW